jgi:hypothetical protein
MTPIIIYLTVGLVGCLLIGLLQETVLFVQKKGGGNDSPRYGRWGRRKWRPPPI